MPTPIQKAQQDIDIALVNYNAAIKEYQLEANWFNGYQLRKAVELTKASLDEAQERYMQISISDTSKYSTNTTPTPGNYAPSSNVTPAKTSFLPIIIAGVIVVGVIIYIVIKRRKK
jgi:hypothetical protein